MTKENRRSTGVVADKKTLEENAKNPTPLSGYDTVEVVQYSDESDEQYQKRVDDLESRKANAEADVTETTKTSKRK
jgi:hypothetical protein